MDRLADTNVMASMGWMSTPLECGFVLYLPLSQIRRVLGCVHSLRRPLGQERSLRGRMRICDVSSLVRSSLGGDDAMAVSEGSGSGRGVNVRVFGCNGKGCPVYA